jgi:carbonic anhydrase/acetyltransferase-like protein (isoleucine patch superfamily)
MIRFIQNKFDFANIVRDRWRAESGQLQPEELRFLRVRRIVWGLYGVARALVLLPVSAFRSVVSAVRILRDHERLHAGPMRRVTRGRDCVVDGQTWIVNGERIFLGDRVKISVYSSVIAGNEATIRIGSNTIIGPGVLIVSINHGTVPDAGPIRDQPWREAAIEIGDDVWIGGGAIVLPGSTIGSGSVVGAGSIVRGLVPPNVIAYMREGALTFRSRA